MKKREVDLPFSIEVKMNDFVKFSDIVDVKKITGCKTCETYSYVLKCHLTEDIEGFLLPFGRLVYPLSHVKIISMDNDFVKISQARVGGNKLKVKFKTDPEKTKELFDIHIAAYVEQQQGISIKM